MQPGIELKEAAIEYVESGLLVVPVYEPVGDRCSCADSSCSRAGKHPRTGHGVLDASADKDQVQAWWSRWPTANVAIATGSASGILVADVDPRDGGDIELHALLGTSTLPTTPTCLTSDGGLHIYFKAPDPGNAPSHKPASGIDLKGDGGYVVAPPSIHASGHQYSWQNPFSRAALATLPAAFRINVGSFAPSIAPQNPQPVKNMSDRMIRVPVSRTVA